MSSSSLSDDGGSPSDEVLEQALRKAVQDVYDDGNLELLTVKRVRKAAELDLGIEEDFFKTTPDWKERSGEIIKAAVESHDQNNASSQPVPFSPKKSPVSIKKSKPSSNHTDQKRKSTEREKPRKRLKKEEAESDDLSEEDVKAAENGSEIGPHEDRTTSNKSADEPPKPAKRESGVDSESEMSVLIDEEPKAKRKKRKKSDPAKPSKAGGKKGKESKKAGKEPLSADQEEIKRLQGWLVKCGIRKVWGKELARFDGTKEKIKHLKQMLSDAGMTGRYSQDKANQIREERELKADLEAVQDGNKRWGRREEPVEEEDEDGGDGARPKRRLAKGLQGLDFLNDDDGEETD